MRIPVGVMIAIGVALTAMWSCTGNVSYRTVSSVCSHANAGEIDYKCPRHSIHRFPSRQNPAEAYTLGIVEYDDQGQLHDRTQAMALLREIESADNPLIVIFVHGWKNNAAPGNSNLAEFRRLLERIAINEREVVKLLRANLITSKNPAEPPNGLMFGFRDRESGGLSAFVFGEHDSSSDEGQRARVVWKKIRNKQGILDAGLRPRQVCGVYVAWRGEATPVFAVKELSFWSRKSAAHRIGEGAVGELLLRLEAISDVKNQQADYILSSRTNSAGYSSDLSNPETPIRLLPSQLIVVGHSMGAAVVFSSISQLLLARHISECYGASLLGDSECYTSGFGDLILLVNPAFEAMQFDVLNRIAGEQEGARLAGDQTPVLIVFTSKADWATKYAFRGGRWFSTLLQLERQELDQARKNDTAVGHYKPYTTHTLERMEDWSQPVKGLKEASEHSASAEYEKLDALLVGRPSHTTGGARSAIGQNASSDDSAEFPSIGVRLTRTRQPTNISPYLFVSVDRALMSGHNDIYDPDFLYFVYLLVALKTDAQSLLSKLLVEE